MLKSSYNQSNSKKINKLMESCDFISKYSYFLIVLFDQTIRDSPDILYFLVIFSIMFFSLA